MIDLTRFIPAEIIEMLKRAPRLPFDANITGDLKKGWYIDQVYRYLIHEGPKMVDVSDKDLFLTLANMPLRFPIKHYQQPYKGMIVRILNDLHIVTAKVNEVLVVIIYAPENKSEVMLISGEGTICDVLLEKGRQDSILWVVNAALAVNSFMVWAGTTLGEYVDPKQARRSQRSGRFRERNIQYVECKQLIKLRSSYRRTKSEETGEGGGKRPHWRSGHMRVQHYGPGNAYTRLQYIDEVFVNKKLFGGELGDSEVVYQ